MSPANHHPPAHLCQRKTDRTRDQPVGEMNRTRTQDEHSEMSFFRLWCHLIRSHSQFTIHRYVFLQTLMTLVMPSEKVTNSWSRNCCCHVFSFWMCGDRCHRCHSTKYISFWFPKTRLVSERLATPKNHTSYRVILHSKVRKFCDKNCLATKQRKSIFFMNMCKTTNRV